MYIQQVGVVTVLKLLLIVTFQGCAVLRRLSLAGSVLRSTYVWYIIFQA